LLCNKITVSTLNVPDTKQLDESIMYTNPIEIIRMVRKFAARWQCISWRLIVSSMKRIRNSRL